MCVHVRVCVCVCMCACMCVRVHMRVCGCGTVQANYYKEIVLGGSSVFYMHCFPREYQFSVLIATGCMDSWWETIEL